VTRSAREAVIVDPAEVIEFWIGDRSDEPAGPERFARWFGVDPAVDVEIRQRFGPLVDEALSGGLVDWESVPLSRIALIIALDQFTRNLFREDSKSFAGDVRALSLVQRWDTVTLDALHPLERYFVLLPWMHSERLEDQLAGERAYECAIREVSAVFRPCFEQGLDFASKHRRVIERFGRFPHRNAALGRESTSEEIAFMREQGSGF